MSNSKSPRKRNPRWLQSEDWDHAHRRIHRAFRKKARWQRLCEMAENHLEASTIRNFLSVLQAATADDPKLAAKTEKLIRAVTPNLHKLDPLSQGPAAVLRRLNEPVPPPDDMDIIRYINCDPGFLERDLSRT